MIVLVLRPYHNDLLFRSDLILINHILDKLSKQRKLHSTHLLTLFNHMFNKSAPIVNLFSRKKFISIGVLKYKVNYIINKNPKPDAVSI